MGGKELKTLGICGAGGLAKEIFDVAQRINQTNIHWREILFVDKFPSQVDSFYGARLISEQTLISEYSIDDIELIVGLGEPLTRKLIFEKFKRLDYSFARLVDPTSIVSKTARIGEGAILCPQSFVSSSVKISENVLINFGGIVGHDINIGCHTVISSSARIGGSSTIGDVAYIGMGAIVKEGLAIGSEAIVGMGSVVHNDIPENIIALGNPARPLRRNENKSVF